MDKVFDYIVTLVWWFFTGFLWATFIFSEYPLWYVILVTVWTIVRSVICYLIYREVKNGR